jgi:ribose 1,5-bisphosphokinase PhnN
MTHARTKQNTLKVSAEQKGAGLLYGIPSEVNFSVSHAIDIFSFASYSLEFLIYIKHQARSVLERNVSMELAVNNLSHHSAHESEKAENKL